jgi:hypothetical protein
VHDVRESRAAGDDHHEHALDPATHLVGRRGLEDGSSVYAADHVGSTADRQEQNSEPEDV